jgi:hypothetical protein
MVTKLTFRALHPPRRMVIPIKTIVKKYTVFIHFTSVTYSTKTILLRRELGNGFGSKVVTATALYHTMPEAQSVKKVTNFTG